MPGEMDRPDERSDARERALYLLYEAHSKGISPADTLDLQVIKPDALTCELVVGVGDNSEELDRLIDAKSQDWSLQRMPVIDINVMRLAAYELRFRSEVPTAVILDEAVGLAKQFSTDNSGRFVNGVLAAIARDLRPSSGASGSGA